MNEVIVRNEFGHPEFGSNIATFESPPRFGCQSTRGTETVVYACDGAYWQHAFVSIVSLLVNNRDTAFDIRMISKTPDPQFFANASYLRTLHPFVEISWLPASDQELAAAPITLRSFTVATYYRLLLARLLPNHVAQVLYLDADTIVRGSLRELFELDLRGNVLAATPNYHTRKFEALHGTTKERLGLPFDTPYFNAGVLRVDLNAWREHEVAQRGLAYIAESARNPARIMYQDQDVLNFVLAGNWKDIGPLFNFVEWTCDQQRWRDFCPSTQPGFMVPTSGPLIAHYANTIKPWHGGCPHPYRSDYWHYRNQTPYSSRVSRTRARAMGAVRLVPWKKVRRKSAKLAERLPYGDSLVHAARSILKSG